MIYLDNAATTKVDRRVAAAMRPYLSDSYGNPSSVHRQGRQASKAIEGARLLIARSFGARPDEVVFTSGGTESSNEALKGIFFARRGKKDHIVTSAIEHPSVLVTCRWLEKQGCRVTYLPVDGDGFVSPCDLKSAISPRTLVVSISAANHEIGTIQAVSELAAVCAEKGVLFHTDACQAFTKVPCRCFAQAGLISLSAHKIHGPKGTGALVVRGAAALSPLLSGGGQEQGLRAGTQDTPGIVGFGKAVAIAGDAAKRRMEGLRDRLIEGVLGSVAGSALNGPRTSRLCNNANFTFKGARGGALMLALDRRGVAVSTGAACTAGSSTPSAVLLAIGLSRTRAQGSIRLSLSKYTTRAEIDEAVLQIGRAVAKIRGKG